MSTSPRRIGQYELMHQIGSGHVGEVWKARDLAQKRDLVVKLLHNDLQADPNFLNRLKNGGRALTSLRHPNLVNVYDAVVSRPEGARETTTFIVSDYIDGHSFTNYLKATAHRGIFPSIQDLIYIFSSLGDALDYIHQHNIVHGNIKPSNILLNKQQRARITAGEPIFTDVGITQIAGNDSHLSMPQYLAPEQAQGHPANSTSDIYALGIILYELCTGSVPFRGESPFAIISQQINVLPAPPTLINVNIPAALSEVILRALAKNPSDRFASATLLANAIAEACSLPAINSSPSSMSAGNGQITPNPKSQPQSILGISQPISDDPPIFMRQNNQQNTSPHAPIKLISLNGNASVSAALVFPNSGAMPAIKKTDTAISQANVNAEAQASQLPPALKANPNSTSGPLSMPPMNVHQQFLTKQPMPSMDNLVSAPQPTLFQTTPPPIQGSYPGRSLNPESETAYLQQSTMPYQSAQPPSAPANQGTPYQSALAPSTPANQAPIPFTHEPTPAPTGIRKNKYILPLIFALVIVVIVSSFGINALTNHNNGQSSAPPKATSTIDIAAPSNAVFFQDDALGHNDQLHITLNNIADPAQGMVYHAWIQTSDNKYISVADLPVNNKQIDYMYGGDQQHSNLLAYIQGIIITSETANSAPDAPSNQIVYQATFDTAILPELKNLLYATPGLGPHEAVPVSLFEAIKSMNDKAASIADSMQSTRDYNLAKRQATRIIESIDGTKNARSSGDLPANLASQINAPVGLLTVANQKGYIDILNDQLDALSQVANNNSVLLQRIQYTKNGLTDLKNWLQKMRTDDVQLLKAANLSSPALIDVALRIRQTANDAYTGHTIPPATAPSTALNSAGSQQVYIETQYMATLNLIAAK